MCHCQGNRLGWRHTDRMTPQTHVYGPFMLSKSIIIALVMSAADMTQTPMSYSDFAWGSVYFIAVRMLRSAPWLRPRLGSRLVQFICMVESLRDCGVRNLTIKTALAKKKILKTAILVFSCKGLRTPILKPWTLFYNHELLANSPDSWVVSRRSTHELSYD